MTVSTDNGLPVQDKIFQLSYKNKEKANKKTYKKYCITKNLVNLPGL
jgi:hypothetical protein